MILEESPHRSPPGGSSVAPSLSVDAIVAVARALLLRGGSEAVGMRELARLLGVVPSALYRHVRDRQHVLDLLAATLDAELADAVTAARRQGPREDPQAGDHAAALAVPTWAERHPAEFLFLFRTPPRRDGSAEAFRSTASALLGWELPTVCPGTDPGPRGASGDGAVVVGFRLLLGVVAVEIMGHARWGVASSVADEVERMAASLSHTAGFSKGAPVAAWS